MSEFKYSTVAVTGDDALAFLQAQLATDLTSIANVIDTPGNTDNAAHRSTWCNPKGRVICTPTVTASDSGFDLSLPADLSESVVARLTMFRFRSRVEFNIIATTQIDDAAQLQLLQAGIPEIASAQTEKYTPHMLNLDVLQMVSVEKGCYPGQEIVARTHFRGSSKRRTYRFACATDVQPGDKISNSERAVGEVVNALHGELLGVIPVQIADSQLFVNDHELHRRELPYKI